MLILDSAQKVRRSGADDIVSLFGHHSRNRTGKMGLAQTGLSEHKKTLAVRSKLVSIRPAETQHLCHHQPWILPALRVNCIGIITQVKVIKSALTSR